LRGREVLQHNQGPMSPGRSGSQNAKSA
jgi:hypothetical protein